MGIRRSAFAHAGACILLFSMGAAHGDVIDISAHRTWQCEVRVLVSRGHGGTATLASKCARVATVQTRIGETREDSSLPARHAVRYLLSPDGSLRRLGDRRPNIQAQRLGANLVATVAY